MVGMRLGRVLVVALPTIGLAAFVIPAQTRATHPAQLVTPRALPCIASEEVPIMHTEPLPMLEPREVISAVSAALHRSNWDSPTAFYGFETALKFLAPSHPAKRARAKPAGFSRFMRQPHKVEQTLWEEMRFEGDVILMQDDDGTHEAYQMVSMRSSSSDEWWSARWKLVKVEMDYGTTVKSQWMVDAVFAKEPDVPLDVEFLRAEKQEEEEYAGLDWNGVLVPSESPREVVYKVMKALRNMDEPYKLHGACVATRYCSPLNRAAELSPQVFAGYLEDPWYSLLVEWDEMQEDNDECDDVDEDLPNVADVDTLVKREGDDSFSLVSWTLSLHNGQWLIDSLNIV